MCCGKYHTGQVLISSTILKKGFCMKRYILECLGAMFLVLIYAMTESPLAIGSMLAVLVYIGSNISGSHYNPAVSLAMRIRGKIKTKDMFYYMGSQILGGFLASLIYLVISDKPYFLVPASWVKPWMMFLIELLFTFFFCYVFLTVMTSKKFQRNSIYGLVIGFALMSIAFLGATFNPAVSIGPGIYKLFAGGFDLGHIPAHLLGALSGGLLAGFAYQFLNVDMPKTAKK